LGIPEWQEWAPSSEYRITDLPRPFWMTGFNGGRTGWSESIALFIPLVYYFLHRKKHFLLKLNLSIGLIVVAQIISGGRNGLAASIIGLLIIAFKEKGFLKVFYFFITLGTIYTLFFFKHTADILVSLRIYDYASEALSDNLTTDRYIMYKAFPDIFLESPFLGQGFNGSQKALYPKYLTQDGLEMHNGILRVLIDHGLFFGILMGFMLLYSLRKSIKFLLSNCNNIYTTLFPVIIIQGIFISLFQPLSLFGGFQISAIWWFSLGMLLKYEHEFKR
jgi:hypothetical protein